MTEAREHGAATASAASAATAGRAVAMVVLIFAHFMDLLDVTIVNVALPSIRADVGASAAQLEWVVGGYTLGFAAVLITAGRLGDIVGRQRMFLLGVAGFTLTSLVAATAGAGEVLVAARVAQGVSAGLMVPQVLSSVQALYAPKERAAVYGVIGAIAGSAAVIGPLLGGWLITHDPLGIGWRTVFGINVPVGIALFAAALRWVPNTRAGRPTRLDLGGAALATLGVGLVVFGLVEGHGRGWPWWIWAALLLGPAVLVGFVALQQRRERAGRDPLVPLHLFGNRGFSAGVLTQAAFQGSMTGFAFVLVIYLQVGQGMSALDAGLTLLPFSLAAFVGSGVAIPLVARLGKALVAGGALAMAGGGWWSIGVVDGFTGPMGWTALVGPMALSGLGLGLLVVPLVDVALATVPVDDAGAASGTFGMMQQVGASLGIAVVGVAFFDRATGFGQAALTDAFVAGAWVCIAGYLVCATASLLLPPRHEVAAHLAEEQAAVPAA